jgi:hypothetical protein
VVTPAILAENAAKLFLDGSMAAFRRSNPGSPTSARYNAPPDPGFFQPARAPPQVRRPHFRTPSSSPFGVHFAQMPLTPARIVEALHAAGAYGRLDAA